jgi:hypothetical protein
VRAGAGAPAFVYLVCLSVLSQSDYDYSKKMKNVEILMDL